MKLNTVLLIGILAIAAFLRFYNLGSVPPSASLDEASIGYNAYSVLKTGGDEYGEFPIISQRGYDDWRRSIYLFLTIPFITFFDLNAVSVRLPAVILSVLTVLATYFLVKELFSRNSKSEYRNPKQIRNSNNQNSKLTLEIGNWKLEIPIIAAAMLAISPWHIYISRLGHESNACLSFLVFGVLFFLQGNRDKNMSKIFLSMIFLTLSMISYYSGQVFIPLFVVGLFFLFRKNILSFVSSDKKILIPFFIFVILLIPVFMAIFSKEALIRFEGTSTFKPEAHSEMFAKRVEMRNRALENNDVIGAIIYSRHLFPIQVFSEGYLSHFKIDWLFTNSSNEPHKVPNLGLLYIWQAPFILLGIILFIFSRLIDIKGKLLIFMWFLLGPLPAAIATQTPHAMRSYNFVLIWQIFTAFGFVILISKIKDKISNIHIKYLIFTLCILFLIFNFLFFFKNYFYVFPKTQSKSFQYVLKDAILYAKTHEDEYEKIVFSNKDNLYQSYMFFLYYSKYDPFLYQKQGGTVSGGFEETHAFGKYEFRPIKWNRENKDQNTLYVGNREDFPEGTKTIKTVDYLNGELGIKIVKGN